jgi:autotransporter-associated beta strand protein
MKIPCPSARSRLLALAAVILPAASLSAATWDGGGGDGNWSTGTNWSANLVPTGAEAAAINVSVTVNHTSASAFTTSGLLTIGGAAAVTTVVNVGPGSGTLQFGGDGFANAARIGDAAGNGTLNISGGKVQVGTGLAGNDASINLATFSGTGTTGSINVSGGELQVGRRILIAANDASRVGNITLSGSGIIRMVATGSAAEGDLGMLRLGSGASTLNFDGGELIGRGIRQDAASATSKIHYNGTKFTLNGNSGTGVSALIGSGGTAVNQIKNGGLKIDTASFNATIARGLANFTGHTGVLTKEGTGTLTMAAAGNTYSQTVVNGGVLDFIATDAFGNHTSSAHVLTVNAGAMVTNSTIAGGFNTFQNLTLNGGELRATNTLNALSGTFQAYHIRGTVTVGGTTDSTISDVGQANGAINIGGTTDLGGGAGANAVFAVANATSSPAADLTVSAKLKNSANSVFAALQTGIDKTGSGTLALTRVNSYTGATNIQQGTLALVNSGSISTSTVINVSAGATLDVSATTSPWSLATGQSLVGNGDIDGDATIAGTVGPGNSLGSLGFADDLTLAGIASMEISATLSDADLITVAASLAFGGTLNVTNLGGTLVEGQSFDLFDFDFAQSSGIFSAVNLPSLDSGLEWNASALYTTGVISVIPEPGTPALLASLAGMLALRRRRK